MLAPDSKRRGVPLPVRAFIQEDLDHAGGIYGKRFFEERCLTGGAWWRPEDNDVLRARLYDPSAAEARHDEVIRGLSELQASCCKSIKWVVSEGPPEYRDMRDAEEEQAFIGDFLDYARRWMVETSSRQLYWPAPQPFWQGPRDPDVADSFGRLGILIPGECALKPAGNGRVEYRFSFARCLPQPYDRIAGEVCVAAFDWLDERKRLGCAWCGKPITDAKRGSKKYCDEDGEGCKQKAKRYRARHAKRHDNLTL